MDESNIIIQCGSSSFLYTLIWGGLLPLFLACLACAAYAFNNRRGDAAAALEALDIMQEITMLALSRVTGDEIDPRKALSLSQNLIRRFRLEALHRPKIVQNELFEILKAFLENSDIAEGKKDGIPNDIIGRLSRSEHYLLDMLRNQTVLEALKQAWVNPGISAPFDELMKRFERASK